MLSNKRLVATCAVVFCCNIVLLSLFVKYNAGNKFYITINKQSKEVSVVPDDFLSFGIDTSEIIQEDKIDFSDEKFRKLATALAPARMRLGGTMSDRLIFSADDVSNVTCETCNEDSRSICTVIKKVCQQKILPFFVITGSEWMKINKFCKATNIKLLFSFNLLLRNGNEWNDENAIEILEYSKKHDFDVDWQLGNEPNSFRHVFNISITPSMLANDFRHLRKLLNEHGYKNSLLIGPDTTRPQPHRPECLQYMVEFLGNNSNSINVRSWHQYYLEGKTAQLEDFWNPDTFELLKSQIETMKNHTIKYNSIPMWLTETSSAYGGGAPELSDSFAASPMWLDKLGLAARYNLTTVIRQSFYGGNYCLIDKNLEPLPDWWLSVLYKKLVGNKVLEVTCKCSRYQRVYAHCANRKYTKDRTAITIFAVNLDVNKATFHFNGTAIHGDNLSIDEYILRAPGNNRKSKVVLLNGWPLYYDSSLPNFTPNILKYGRSISLPPYSIGFWVIKNTSIKICK